MPVNNSHPAYNKVIEKVTLTEAAVEGDVKTEEFVPRLSEQTTSQWKAYVSRAAYYNVTQRSLLALIGALMRKPFSVSGLIGDEPAVDDTTFNEFLQRSYATILTHGRLGLHVDFDEELGTPKLIAYGGIHIINWCKEFVVISESVHEADPKDPFAIHEVPQWRELRLNEDGQYEVRLWRQVGNSKKQFEVIDTRVPVIRGRPLDYIPFWFVTPYDNTTDVHTPPLYSLAELNIQHFRMNVDHCHGLHFTALPTPVIVGSVSSEGVDVNAPPKTLRIGSETAWHLSHNSSYGYLEFSGSGLGSVAEKIKHIEDQMYQSGARLLTTKAGIESAEALTIRSGSESAMLHTMASALETGLSLALTTYNEWAGSSAQPEIELNKDFTAAVIDPSQLKVLLEAYSAGVITLESLIKRMYEGELVDDVAEEVEALTKVEEPTPPVVEPTTEEPTAYQ